MHTTDRITRIVEVSAFDRITLQAINIENEFVVKQGQRESLTIEARPEVFDKIKTETHSGRLTVHTGSTWCERIMAALSTSLTRPHVKYVVTTPRLTDLDIACLADVRVEKVETDRLHVRFGGPGHLAIAGLKARQLEIDVAIPSPCQIEVSGQVSEQRVSLNGLSDYSARDLGSEKTTVVLSGPGGHAVVQASAGLDVTIRGPGRVEYYGHPQVAKKVSPMGVVTRLDAIDAVSARA